MESLSAERAEQVEALVRCHQPSVRGYLTVLGCPARLLDDLVQDVFLSVLRSAFEERGPAETAAFLRKVARHLFLKTVERERLMPVPLSVDEADAAWDAFEADDGGEGYLDALRHCLGRLEARARGVLELRYAERLDRPGIAARLAEAGSRSRSIPRTASRNTSWTRSSTSSGRPRIRIPIHPTYRP